jgi:hypothetical protein
MFLDRRVKLLETQQARRKAHEIDHEFDFFRIACSCPPDKRLHMRGGTMHAHPLDGDRSWYVNSLICDFEDSDSIIPVVSFTLANWYQSYALVLASAGQSGTFDFRLVGDDDEFETATEAEDNVMNVLNAFGFHIWGVNYPLCGVVLRNDGATATEGAILPIDPINRGRSYTWPMDTRPRNIAL